MVMHHKRGEVDTKCTLSAHKIHPPPGKVGAFMKFSSTLDTCYMCFNKNSDCNNINIQLALLQTVIKHLC